MAALPYMQFYIADYLADTMHLSTEEHGAYLLLLFNYWQTGKAIPKARLAKIARMTNERWISVEDSLREFFNDTGTEWRHERIENELIAVKASIKQKREAGLASAAKRNLQNAAKKERERNERSTVVASSLERSDNENPTNKDKNINKDLKDKTLLPGAEKNQLQPADVIPLPEAKPPDKIFICLPLSGGGGEFDVTENYLASLQELYPGVDMFQELRNMRGWLDSNPTKRKTARGIKRFVTNWLQKRQDNPGSYSREVNHGENLRKSGESYAERQLRAGREQWEREQANRQHPGVATVGSHGENLRESLDHDQWQSSERILGYPGQGDDG